MVGVKMLVVLSPAKNMKKRNISFENIPSNIPCFQKETRQLLSILQGYTPEQLGGIFRCNPEIALRAFVNYQNFLNTEGTERALFAYDGLQYKQIAAETLTEEDILFAENSIRMLSAFYGILSPCDMIKPYRLDFTCKIKELSGTLYPFWGEKLYQELFRKRKPVINLASAEYSKAVTPYITKEDQWINCEFLTCKKGKYCMPATEAKMARGQMARYIIKNKINSPMGLTDFCWHGYAYEEQLSDYKRLVFLRTETNII